MEKYFYPLIHLIYGDDLNVGFFKFQDVAIATKLDYSGFFRAL